MMTHRVSFEIRKTDVLKKNIQVREKYKGTLKRGNWNENN